jgi:hypothetical protein
VRRLRGRRSLHVEREDDLERAAFYWNRFAVIVVQVHNFVDRASNRKEVRAGSQEEGVGRASARPTTTETVECDPSFHMAELVSPLSPLSMMAFQAKAEGGDRFCGRH